MSSSSIDILREARNSIKNGGIIPKERGAEIYLEAIGDIKREINLAKIKAIKDAELPFLERLREVEEEYAILLKLQS